MRCDILFIVDHKWRDLPGLVMLSRALEVEQKISSALVSYTDWRFSLLKFRPKILVIPVFNGDRTRLIIEACKELGIKVVAVMTEGRPNNFQNLDHSVGGKSYSSLADFWFTWGPVVKDFMLEKQVVSPERIYVAGSQRFDIYNGDLKKLVQPRADFLKKYGLDPDKPVASWATNFTHARFYKSNLDFMIRDWNDLGLSRYPVYSNPSEMAKGDWDARVLSGEAIRHLLREMPELQLMVKPHPGEDHDFYLEFVKNCRAEFGNRVVFIGFEYIWDLLNAANVHIHRLCTTGVEAWFLNVPSIDLHLKDYFCWSLDLPGAASESVAGNDLVQTPEELVAMVKMRLAGVPINESQKQARQRYIDRWIYKVDGKRSSEHAKVFSKLLNAISAEGVRLRVPFKWTYIKSYLKGHLRDWVGVSSSREKNSGLVDKTIRSEDVETWKNKLREMGF